MKPLTRLAAFPKAILLAGVFLVLPATAEAAEASGEAPHLIWTLPFVILLLAIAVLPLLPPLMHWWEKEWNKLIVALVLSCATCLYYAFRHSGGGALEAVGLVLKHSVLDEYIPFIVLLFSLFVISGNIHLSGDLPARPMTNVIILAIGALLASFIGTTGASMLLIRPLLQTNSERKHVTHTVIFFIFLVSNVGGLLLPVGDPPLFLGYLRNVPFTWTLGLYPQWLFCIVVLLGVYAVIESFAYRREREIHLIKDELQTTPLKLRGTMNFLLLGGVVLAVAFLVPGKELIGTSWIVPEFMREAVQLALAALAFAITSREIRTANGFNFRAIGEVAALFIGIFITMQVPLEILNIRGGELGLHSPAQFFWATGILSSFLDNAPTYVVFFATAGSTPDVAGPFMENVILSPGVSGEISIPLLTAISLGAVFMGANTYIGNGPNFMVKSIAEQSGVPMPSFFGYMAYSALILIPIFILVTLIFL